MDAAPRYVLLPYITYKRKQLDKIAKVINLKFCSISKLSEEMQASKQGNEKVLIKSSK
jgi:hypothetical protein